MCNLQFRRRDEDERRDRFGWDIGVLDERSGVQSGCDMRLGRLATNVIRIDSGIRSRWSRR